MKFNQPIKKSKEDIEFYKKNAPKFGTILKDLRSNIENETLDSTYDINSFFNKACRSVFGKFYGFKFPFEEVKNYLDEPFNGSVCLSADDCVAHGKLFEGNIISVDCGLELCTNDGNLIFDSAFTVDLSEQKQPWVSAPQEALVEVVKRFNTNPGPKTTNFISEIIHEYAKSKGLQVVVSMSGHGIGHTLHEHPYIFNAVPDRGVGEPIFDGLVLCIEPVFVLPNKDDESTIAKTYLDSDGWSIKTISGQPGSHFESMFLVEKGKLVDLVGITEWFC
jgi:methionyl aminopeptidase